MNDSTCSLLGLSVEEPITGDDTKRNELCFVALIAAVLTVKDTRQNVRKEALTKLLGKRSAVHRNSCTSLHGQVESHHLPTHVGHVQICYDNAPEFA